MDKKVNKALGYFIVVYMFVSIVGVSIYAWYSDAKYRNLETEKNKIEFELGEKVENYKLKEKLFEETNESLKNMKTKHARRVKENNKMEKEIEKLKKENSEFKNEVSKLEFESEPQKMLGINFKTDYQTFKDSEKHFVIKLNDLNNNDISNLEIKTENGLEITFDNFEEIDFRNEREKIEIERILSIKQLAKRAKNHYEVMNNFFRLAHLENERAFEKLEKTSSLEQTCKIKDLNNIKLKVNLLSDWERLKQVEKEDRWHFKLSEMSSEEVAYLNFYTVDGIEITDESVLNLEFENPRVEMEVQRLLMMKFLLTMDNTSIVADYDRLALMTTENIYMNWDGDTLMDYDIKHIDLENLKAYER